MNVTVVVAVKVFGFKETLNNSSCRSHLRILAHCCIANPRRSVGYGRALQPIPIRQQRLAARLIQNILNAIFH